MDLDPVSEARAFPNGSVASPHHLASAAGLAALASGGNAVDAAVAANLALGVVAPYLCGYGGDLFALVWREGEGLWAYNGSGRAPAAATAAAVRSAASSDEMPALGPLPVTVPGAVEGWFVLLERYGTRSFEELALWGLAYAEEGFRLTGRGAESIERSKLRFGARAPDWLAVYGDAAAGSVLRQPDLARTIRAIADGGPDAYYRGPIAQAITDHVQRSGGLLTVEDLARHRGEPVAPLSATYRDVDVFELPPNTQGVAALEALSIVEAATPEGLMEDGLERQHLLVEATKLAFADRDEFVTDPDHMATPPAALLDPDWIAARAGRFDPSTAGVLEPGRAAVGGTAYLCAADRDGTLVSLIQSNYMGFGSGVTVPGWGVNLHNRGAFFSLDPAHANVVAPHKRPLHTLIPAMALREGRPWLVFGTMGGDGQVPIHVQLIVRMVDDREDAQRAIDAPRWVVSPKDGGVTADERFPPALLEGLVARGHPVGTSAWHDGLFGHAHAIVVTPEGYLGASDRRAEGAALGL
jgi:gamma-glutamyltranspeptidase/glutathione hydrolase